MLKNSRLPGTPSITGNVARTTGTAPRRPAQPSSSRSRTVKRSSAVPRIVAAGRATTTRISASSVPSITTSPSWLGKTSSPSARNIEICATQASPWWKVMIVRFAGTVAVPRIRPAR
jgi:hypothetical protein